MLLSKIKTSLMLSGISLCLLIIPASAISQLSQMNVNPDSVFHGTSDVPWDDYGFNVITSAQGDVYVFTYKQNYPDTRAWGVYVYTIDHNGKLAPYKMGSNNYNDFYYGFPYEGTYYEGMQGNSIAFIFNDQLWHYINQWEDKTRPENSYDCFAMVPIPHTGNPRTYYDLVTGTPDVIKKGAFQHDSTLYFLGTYNNSSDPNYKKWCLQRYTYNKSQNRFHYSTTISIQGDIPGDHFGGIVGHTDPDGNHRLVLNTYDRPSGDICLGWLSVNSIGLWEYTPEPLVTSGSASQLVGGSIKGCRTPDQIVDSFTPERFTIFVVHGGHTMTYHEYFIQTPPGTFFYEASTGSVVLASSLAPYATHDGAYHLQGAAELVPTMFHNNVGKTPDGFRQQVWVYYADKNAKLCGARFLSDSWQFIPDSTVTSYDLADDDLYGPQIRSLWTLVGIIDGGPPCSVDWAVWKEPWHHPAGVMPTSLEFDYTNTSKTEVTTTSEDQFTIGANFKTDNKNLNFGVESKFSDTFKNTVSNSTTFKSEITKSYVLTEENQEYGVYIYSVPTFTRYTYKVFPWWDTGFDYPVQSSVQFRFVVTGVSLLDRPREISKFPFLIEHPNDTTLNDWKPASRTYLQSDVSDASLSPACSPTWASPETGFDYTFESIADTTTAYEHKTSLSLESNYSGAKPEVFELGASVGNEVSFSTSTKNVSEISSKLTVSLKNLVADTLGLNIKLLALQAYWLRPEDYDWWFYDSLGTERPWYIAYLVTTANQEVLLTSPEINEKADEKGKLFSWYAKGCEPGEYTLLLSTSPHISPSSIIMQIDAGTSTYYYMPTLPSGYDKIYWAVRGITRDKEFVWSETRPLRFGNDEETDLPVWNLTAVPYPNPGNGQALHLLLDTKQKGKVTVRVLTVNGTTVYESVLGHPAEGPQTYELPQMSLSRGIYILDATINNERAVKKLTVF